MFPGITTTNSFYIDNAEVISNSRQLKNISSLDSVTTATIESAIANAPNTFTDLSVSGISTLNVLNVTGVSTLSSLSVVGLTTVNRFYAETVVVSAAATIGFITATNVYVSGTTTSININSTNSNTAGIATVGFLTATNADISGIITANRLNASTANVSVAATIQNITTPILNVSVASTIQTLNTTSLTNSGDVSIGSSLVVDTNTFIVDSVANSVGIGTTPGHKLHVEGDVSVSDLLYVSNGRGITGQVLLSQGSHQYGEHQMRLLLVRHNQSILIMTHHQILIFIPSLHQHLMILDMYMLTTMVWFIIHRQTIWVLGQLTHHSMLM